MTSGKMMKKWLSVLLAVVMVCSVLPMGIITEATASSIEFDKELNSVFRRLSFKVEFCLCEEGSA